MAKASAIGYQTVMSASSEVRRTSAIRVAVMAEHSEINRSTTRRSARSATAPDSTPNRKKGAMLADAATPTMKGESVISKTSHPRVICSMPTPI